MFGKPGTFGGFGSSGTQQTTLGGQGNLGFQMNANAQQSGTGNPPFKAVQVSSSYIFI
jgi:hypothetical protein